MNDDLATVMTRLSEPAPPPSLKATVMARIARDAGDRQSAHSVSTVPAGNYRDKLVWIAMVAGLAVVAGAVAYGLLDEGSLPSMMSPRVGPVRIPFVPDGPSALVVGLGLLVYLVGLFGPLRSDARR
jgi:hypothetical protein